jgi:UDP-3-O-[3-hydroxymyristoyl] N-acetylglucosamine deacetylase
MQNVYQKTVEKSVHFSGIGLHSGASSKITINPGKPDQGIVFKRIDLKKNNLVKANYKNVTSANLCTTLENSYGVKVSTVEHLLAAFYIVGIDNALVEINCEEIPIMDGSAKDFLDVLKKIKIISLNKKRKYLKITDKIELKDGSKTISIEPNQSSLEVDFQLNYKNKIIGNQRNNINFQKDKLDDISNSRTFCLFEDVEKIKKIGLAKGGSLDNALVVDEDKVLNKGGLRNQKEFVNHKILDLAGDFLLSGYRILGKVKCYQGGHQLTNQFLRKMLSSQIKHIKIPKTEVSKKLITITSSKLAVNA